MAAIEDIVAWCNAERVRLGQQLEQLQSGHLRTYEKLAQPPGWLEIDTTAGSIDLCRQYISELNAIVARYPAVVPPPAPISPRPAPPAPVVVQPVLERDAIHPDWVHGWGVVKGADPNWDCKGVYPTRPEAEEAAAKAGEGYYMRWGSYNAQSKEFLSGPSFGLA